MSDTEKLKIAMAALKAIADCDESDLVKYCQKVDLLAIDALVKLENLEEIWDL